MATDLLHLNKFVKLSTLTHSLPFKRFFSTNFRNPIKVSSFQSVKQINFSSFHKLEFELFRKSNNLKPKFSTFCSKSDKVTSEYEPDEDLEPSMGAETLKKFVDLNIGSWHGTFTQFDCSGRPLHTIPTILNSTSIGKGEDICLQQTLKVKQAPLKVVMGEEEEKDEKKKESIWNELLLDDTNIFTVDKRQQLGYFHNENAFSISHLTAEVLDKILKIGVLGNDDIDEEFPKGLKLPSRRPALVNEICLYNDDVDKKERIRAFHVLDSRGLIDTLAVFRELKSTHVNSGQNESNFSVDDLSESIDEGEEDRVHLFLGEWKGKGKTIRSSIYGGSVTEQEFHFVYSEKEDGKIAQEMNLTVLGKSFKINAVAERKGNMLSFTGGLQLSFLPHGIYMLSPACIVRGQSFIFECGWVFQPGKRRRVVRTYDSDGMVVSTTFSSEVKV